MMQLAINLGNAIMDNAGFRSRKPRTPRVHKVELIWEQLCFKLSLRRIAKTLCGFVWTRPDGKQVIAKNVRGLVARIMDYDGHQLASIMRQMKNAGLVI